MEYLNDVDRAEERLKELATAAFKVNLEATFAYIAQFSNNLKGVIGSEIPTIDGLEIEFKKIDRAFEFSTGPINSVGPPVIYQNCYYGLTKPFDIQWNGNVLKVLNGAGEGHVQMGKGFSTSGQLYDLRTPTSDEKCYFRALLPLNKSMHTPLRYMRGSDFTVGGSYRACGMINLNLNGLSFRFFDYDWENISYIFFESADEIKIEEFNNYLDVVLAVFALISGSYIRDERWILASETASFETIQGFIFDRQVDSIDAQEEIVSPFIHKEYAKLQERIWLKELIFNKLVQFSLEDKRLLRAVKLIAEARGIPVELAVASYCVALETVKGIVVERNESKLKPIKNKEQEENIIRELKMVLNSFPESDFSDKMRVLRKIDDINKVGNNEGFLLAFEILEINLSSDEKNFIRNRNKFLHGEIPFSGEDPSDPHHFKLKKVSLHIHMLTCALILKMAGYSGPILNFWKYWELARGENNEPMPLFRDI